MGMMNKHPDQSDPASASRLKRLLTPSWELRKRMLRRETWLFLVTAYVLTAYAYLWPSDFRRTSSAYVWSAWAAVMIRTFLAHAGLLLVPIAIVTAWRRSWRMLAVTLPLLAVTLGPTLWQYRPRSYPTLAGEYITVMSVNLLMVNRDTAPIIREIQTADPDVLFLQEYAWHWHQAIQDALADEYPYFEFVTREDSFGAAVYSRRSFVEKVDIYAPLGEAVDPQMRAVIEIAGREVVLYNIHLLPPWGLRGTIEHRAQFADLVELVADEPRPVVIAGDFNFTENSPQATMLRGAGMADAHDLGGWGRGATWPVNSFFRAIPSLRLDHIYVGGGLTCAECQTGVGRGSDHRPVIARIGFAE